MAKKSKNHGSGPRGPATAATPSTAPSAAGTVHRVLATAQQAVPLAALSVPDWIEEDILELVDHLPPDARTRFQGFLERFSSIGASLKEACRRQEEARKSAEASRQGHDDALQSLRGDKEMLALEREDLEKRSKTLEADESALAGRTAALIDKERAVILRETEIRAGLFEEQQSALSELRAQIASLEAQRRQLPIQIEEERQALLRTAQELAEATLSKASTRIAEVERLRIELGDREIDLSKREQRLRVEESLIDSKLDARAAEIGERFEQDLRSRDATIIRIERQRGKLVEQVDALQAELDEFLDLRDQVGGDPQVFVDNFERLKAEKKQLDRRVQELLESRSDDDTALIRSQRDTLRERLQEAEAELFSLRHRASEWQRSVTEREDWQLERAALTKRRELLAEAVRRLQDEVDGLINRQSESTAFPELTRMDAELSVPAVTEQAPNLKSLIPELQARIAFAEPGKELHFRVEDLQLFVGGLAMSQLHIFQGISGTGKTSLATAFAKAVGGVCTTIPVQAGWRDRTDLLGHYNAFEKRYYERNTLQAIYRAQTEADRDRIHVVLLDEMNLSRPEQYFAEFLSAMELSERDRWINLMESRPAHGAPAKLRDGRDILLPTNLWFIGTANQDETTSAFADKTHDRSFVLELPKQEPGQRSLPRPTTNVKWRYASLLEQFDAAARKHAPMVSELVDRINASKLTAVLENDFELGWGNRLERQIGRFLPVVRETGGTLGLGVDHLLCSRMFREGKVTGRHDVKVDDLKKVEDAMMELWIECGLEGEPTRCLRQLKQDIARVERNG